MAWLEQFYGIASLEEFRRRVPDEETARRLLEALVWQKGRFCPLCRNTETRAVRGPRLGLYECCACRRQFAATTRTPLHGTKLPIKRWLEAIYLTLMSSKGISSVVLARQIGISQSSAWKVAHAIRLLMRPAPNERLSGKVEIDTVAAAGDPRKRNIRRHGSVGRLMHNLRGRGSGAPVALVAIEKSPKDEEKPARSGRARTAPVAGFSSQDHAPALDAMVAPETVLRSDDDVAFKKVGKRFAEHETVVHSSHEYARGDVHANAVEGFNSTVRRAYVGVWHFWSEKHGLRYMEELGFRQGQRRVVPKKRTVRGMKKIRFVSEPIPVVEQMADLFAHAVGREMRRTTARGIKELSRFAASRNPAGSVPDMPDLF